MEISHENSLKFRNSLNRFRNRKLSANELADLHPNCECEYAYSEKGSKGQVLDHEIVRIFLSTRNFDVKDEKDLEVERFNKLFKERAIAKVFKTGLSVCRISEGYASHKEIIETVEQVYQNLVIEKKCGGLFGHIDISVGIVRNAFEDCRKFCIYETPSGPIKLGKFSRPSHADIVWSKNFNKYHELYIESKSDFYRLLKSQGTIVFWNDLETSEYSRFLPKKIKQQLSERHVN